MDNGRKEFDMNVSRKNFMATTGALLTAGAVPALADDDDGRRGNSTETLYGHGMVWNRELPGVAGEVKLSFDLRVNLQTGTGFGTADDPVHPDWNIHFAINSAKQKKVDGAKPDTP